MLRRLTSSLLTVPPAAAAAATVRHQTRVPNKGYRHIEKVPDRLKDAMSLFGNRPPNVHDDPDPTFVPEEKRAQVYQSVMGDTKHLRVHSKLDRLRTELDAVRNLPPAHERWKEVYLFMRTTEMIAELVADPTDVFPGGRKLSVQLDECEEPRVPTLLQLPNGMIVMPFFSMEEYIDHYFGRADVFESCWFPHPRNGSQLEVFNSLEFPVCGIGSIEQMAMLATVALGGVQVALLLNPCQAASKFVTYPEMVHLTQARRTRVRDRSTALTTTDAAGNETFIFDPHTIATFNTLKMPVKRVLPSELPQLLKDRAPIPPVAQMELHLLLYPYPEITAVYVRSVLRPRWRRMLGGPERMTQIDVVCAPERKPDPAFFEHLKRWSYMREFDSEVHVELTSTVPQRDGAFPFMRVYEAADGTMLREMATFKGLTIAQSLDYDAPLTDNDLHDQQTADLSLLTKIRFERK